MALVPGSNAGPYRIVGPLGRGGMATVYEAYEPRLDRHVALKVLPREFLHDPSFAERFRREAQALAKLEHPNIIPIYAYDIEEAEALPWMAMRLVKTGSLADLLKRERLARPRAVAILRGVADALDYAHRQGMVHRDVKPQNVLLDEAGRVYLADFGLAKMYESSGGLTASGMITGTPQYMAPEQATGLKIGPPADVYALGIVAYEMFTGEVPFAADTPVAVLMKHVQEPLPLPPPDVVPEPLLRALLRATTKKPEDRWPSAGAFVDALALGLGAPAAASVEAPTISLAAQAPVVSTRSTPPAPGTAPPLPPRPPVMRPPAPRSDGVARPSPSRTGAIVLAVGALGLVALVAAGALGLWLWGMPAPTAPPQAPATVEPARPASTPLPRPASTPPATPTPPTLTTARPTPTPAPPAPTAVPAPALPPSTAPAAAPPAAAVPTAPVVDAEVERLAAELAQSDAGTRRRAAQELAARGPAAAPAVPALVTALADRSPDVRLRSAEALGRIGPSASAAAPALAAALRDSDPLVPAEAAKALGLLGDAAAPAAEALGSALGHKDVAVRREAARALARMGRRAEPALSALVAALSDKDKTVCAQAARALGRLGEAARPAVPRLTALSRDPDVLVSREAQGALESIAREQP